MEEFFSNDENLQMLKMIVFHKPKEEVDKMVYKGLNILNENRISAATDSAKKPNEMGKSVESFDQFLKRKGTNMGFKFNFSNGFGKKTQLNFGVKRNQFK